jgi:hypothetical protein
MNDATHIPEDQAKSRMVPIFSATAIPVKAEPAEPSEVGVPFTLAIEAARVLNMPPVSKEAVHNLDGCRFQCKVIEFKETESRGMVVSIDKIHRGEVVVPFHCNRDHVHDLVSASRPPKKFEFHPERHSWGVLVREEKNQDNLVLILGATVLLAGPKAAGGFLLEPMGDLAQDVRAVLQQHGLDRPTDYIELNSK